MKLKQFGSGGCRTGQLWYSVVSNGLILSLKSGHLASLGGV